MTARRAGRYFVLFLVLLAVSITLTRVRDRAGETPVYRKAAQRALRGQQFYRPNDPPAFTYPPLMVLVYMPLAHLPAPVARCAWYMTNLLLVCLIVAILKRLAAPAMQQSDESNDARGGAWRRRLTVGLIAALAVRFAVSPIEYQSHDLVLFALVMLAIASWARQWSTRAGWWAGLAAAVKATPLLLAVPLLRQRRLVALTTLLLVCTAATLLPDVLFKNPHDQLWVQSWYTRFVSKVKVSAPPEAQGAWVSWNMLNQSLTGTLYRLTTTIDTPRPFCWNTCLIPLTARSRQLVTLVAQLGILAWVLYAANPSWLRGVSPAERSFRVLGQGSVVLAAMLLLSPMSSKQHFCVLLAPICFLVVDFVYHRRSAVTALALTVLLLLGAVAGKDVVGAELHTQLAGYGSLTACTIMALLACGLAVRGRALAGCDVGADSSRRAADIPALGCAEGAPLRRAA